jgi:L-ascorbate metabolism protein UlaG (beta-lactamase superfamily)
MADTDVTWLGHGTFRIDTPGAKRVYVDPWLGNPKCPEAERDPERIDVIALTHGHDDHLGETVELAKRFGCPVVGVVELRGWLKGKGVPDHSSIPEAANKGGTVDADGVKITFTDAKHSSSVFEGGTPVYLGEPAGLVIEVENGTTLYVAGDTCLFGDMTLIGRVYEPDVAILPIGDHYTMGPREAAVAVELLGVDRCIPCHYGTFPLLTGTPAELRSLLTTECEILEPAPGETVTV